ncbi:MAG: hypothetical protein V1897_06870 [Pseudomonadota bacterium]
MDKKDYWADKIFKENEPKDLGSDSLIEFFESDLEPTPPSDWLKECKDFDYGTTPTEPGARWVNDEKPAPPSPIKRGFDSAWEFSKTINLDELKPQIAYVLAWTKSGETLDLGDELWADFVKAKFAFDPELQFPDEFEILSGATELWEKGFQKGLRAVLEQEQIWNMDK